MKNKSFDTKRLVLLAALTGILLLMSFTPLGYLNIGPLAITLNMIPVAIGAIALGPSGGAVLGAIFGITSCLQCVGIGGSSPMGVDLFQISPVLTLIQRFVPRLLTGWISGWIYLGAKKLSNSTVAGFLTGFGSALTNTVLFMASLIFLFGGTEYLQDMINTKVPVEVLTALEVWFGNISFLPAMIVPYLVNTCVLMVFVCVFVGINAVFELIAATIIVGPVTVALKKARLIGGE